MPEKRALPQGYPDSRRSKERLTTGWRFHLGDVGGAEQANFDDATWETINIPHTLKLTSLDLDGSDDDKTQLTFHRDVGWYRRRFSVDADPERKVFFEFEGAHQVTDAWVNGKHVGCHAIGGYTPFHFDVSDFVRRDGKNVIALRVDNTRNPDVPPDPGPFDYIKFGGLYRDLYMVQTDKLYIPFAWESLGDKAYDADIRNLPPAALLDAEVATHLDATGCSYLHFPQSSGNQIGPDGPGSISVEIEIGDDGCVTVRYVSSGGGGSVWLNGFVLSELPG